ncbi:choice-of-anchor M domain-containing protein, partial [Nesterenkonia haasae]|uniref:choice-of-anchor M domain-containing protein n=1 Tax=Nesterenkonia haasae TaxID=2587813 RepID=UPI00192EC76B
MRETNLKKSLATGVLTVMGAALLMPLTAVSAAAEPDVDERPYVIGRGHVDAFYFNVGDERNPYEDSFGADQPYLALKDDTVSPFEIRRPEDVELYIKQEAFVSDFPAVAAVPQELHGESAYHLPLSQDSQLLWPGWESQPLQGRFDTVDINITDVEGPGDVYLWTTSSFGQLVTLLDDDRVQFPGTIHQSYLAHVHAHWAFTEPGDYVFSVAPEVHSSHTGESIETNTEEYLFSVGEFVRTPDVIDIAGSTSYEEGDTIELTALPERAAVEVPRSDRGDSSSGEWATVTPSWRWEIKDAEDEWNEVEAQSTDTYSVEADGGTQEIRAVATYVDEFRDVEIDVVSTPVTVTTDVAQSVELAELEAEYNQGEDIHLRVEADPELTEGHDVTWEWQLPGTEWTSIPEAAGTSHTIQAEHALNGAQIRAVVAAGGETHSLGPATIAVNVTDEPQQVLTIGGAQSGYAPGDAVDLSLSVEPATVLDSYQWYLTLDGEDQATALEGATAATHSFTFSEDLDGASVHATLRDGNSQAVYGPADPVVLHMTEDEPDPEPTETVSPSPT